MNDDALFETLDLLNFNNTELTPLYKNTTPVHHNYFKSLLHTQIGEEWIISHEILFERNLFFYRE